MQQYVLISGQSKNLTNIINNLKEELSITNIKVVNPRIYFETSIEDNFIKLLKTKIKENKTTQNYVYQIFPIDNGKIDYLPYISKDTKQKKYSYYK